MAVRLALFQPDIPQNTGTILRLAACLGIEVHIIGPAGFPTTDRSFRRAGMDYLDRAAIVRHASWHAFEIWRSATHAPLVLLTTQASLSYLDHQFCGDDVLLFGREFGRYSRGGAPDRRHQTCHSNAARDALA